MTQEQIEQRIRDIRNEIHLLDDLSASSDDVNIHCIQDQIEALQKEKNNLQMLIDLSFDELIGL